MPPRPAAESVQNSLKQLSLRPQAGYGFDQVRSTLRLNGLLTLRSLRPTRTAAGFAVPRRARLLTLDDRAYFRLRNGALVDDAGDSVDTPTAFRLAETEAVLRAEAAAAGRSRLRARSRIAAWAAREFWIGVLLASLAGYAALGAYLLIVLPGRLLGVW